MFFYIFQADLSDDETLELIDLETRELLEKYGFECEKTPVICGSALLALQNDTSKYGVPSIKKLLDSIDDYLPTPERNFEAPFILPIDNTISVVGRGTVVVGTIKQGTIKKNAEANLIGYDETFKTTVSDIQVGIIFSGHTNVYK